MAPLGSLYVLVKELLELNCMNKCRCMFGWAYLWLCVYCGVWVRVGCIGLHRMLVYFTSCTQRMSCRHTLILS